MVTHGKYYEAEEHRASLEIPGEELSDATHTFLGKEGSPKKAKEQAHLLERPGGRTEEPGVWAGISPPTVAGLRLALP